MAKIERAEVNLESESEVWSALFHTTAELLVAYSPVVVYYVKVHHPLQWKELIGEDSLGPPTPLGVLKDIIQQRGSLESVGATAQVFKNAQELQKYYDGDASTMIDDRLRFLSTARALIDALPFSDAFPYDPDERLDDKRAEMRRICGVFFTLQFKFDKRRKWFNVYAETYSMVTEKEKNKETARKTIHEGCTREISESDGE